MRGGQDRRDGFFVVLEVAEVLLTEFTVVRRHPLAVVGVRARLHLVDEVAHGQGVILRGAEDQRLLLLVDLAHEDLDTLLLALFDLDNLVEVALLVALLRLDLALDELIVRRIDILVECCGDLLHFEGRQEAVVDAILERVNIDRLAEVAVGVHVVFAFGRGSQTELHRRGKIFKNTAPIAFIVGPAAMALVNDDEIEEVRRIVAEIPLDRLGGRRLNTFRDRFTT